MPKKEAFDGSQIEKGKSLHGDKDKYNLFRQQVKDSFVADCAMAVLKALVKLYQQRKVYRKNETAWMECELDRKEEAHHVSESGWKESA